MYFLENCFSFQKYFCKKEYLFENLVKFSILKIGKLKILPTQIYHFLRDKNGELLDMGHFAYRFLPLAKGLYSVVTMQQIDAQDGL